MFRVGSATEGVMLTFGNGGCGVGMAAAGFGPIFGAISRQTPPAKRSVALGVATAGGSFGQFAVVPFASLLQYRLGECATSRLSLCVFSRLIVALSLRLREATAGAPRQGAPRPPSRCDPR